MSRLVHELAEDGDYRALLVELLATVHRDGGQYTQLAGIAISVEDAVEKVVELHRVKAALTHRVKQLVNKIGNG